MNTLLQLFRSFYPVSEAEASLIEMHCRIDHFAKKETYAQIGKTCTTLGFVTEGIFKVSSFKPNGDEYIKYFVQEGHFAVDVQSFFYQTPATEHIEALTPCRVLTFTKASYTLLEEQIPNFSKILNELKQKAMLEKLTLKNEMLVDDAATKYQKFVKRYPTIHQRISQRHIALHLGISEYTLSRVRAQR